jgi:hypothetical protein
MNVAGIVIVGLTLAVPGCSASPPIHYGSVSYAALPEGNLGAGLHAG